ncbi:MAG: sulfatase [Myxococcota bacterium]|nr:sulfatase [Myxococcota bacterium]
MAAGAGLLGCDLFTRHRPNVLLVTIDTLRADHVGAYGYEPPTTPHIDRLAEGGALFETTYAPMGTTTPSHATLFTSRHPLAHGVVRNGLALLEAERTLAEVMRQRGYTTAAFVSSFPVSQRFGLAQGFDHYDDDFEASRETFRVREWEGHAVDGRFDRRGSDTTRVALAWLEALEPDTPVFLWLHLFDPHGPYVAPKAFQAFFPLDEGDRFHKRRARYDAEIRYADAELGRVLAAFAALSPASPPLVMVTSDHGEGLSEHGWPDHNRTLYEEELRVPWVVHWPGHVPAGVRPAQPAHLVDVAPTLLGLLGIEPEALFEGRDWSDLLDASRDSGEPNEPGAPDPKRALWLQRPYYPDGHPRAGDRGWGFGLRAGDWKLIETDGQPDELYHLERDPRERRNLAAARADRVQALSQRIRSWRREQAAKAEARSEEIPEEVRVGLEALGYGEGPPEGEEPAP